MSVQNLSDEELLKAMGVPSAAGTPAPSGAGNLSDEELLALLQPAPKRPEDDSFFGDVKRAAGGRVIGLAQLGDTLSDYNPVDWAVKKMLPEGMVRENEGKRKVFQENLSDTTKQIQEEQQSRGLKGLPGAILGDPLTYLPIPGNINAATKGARALQAAKIGGKFGILGGATDPLTEDQSRLGNVALQGATGAAFGGASQPLLDTASIYLRKLANAIFAPNTAKINQIDEAARLISDPEIAKQMKPTMQAVTDKPWVASTANVMENIPFVGNRFTETGSGYEKATQAILNDARLKGVVQPEDAGRAMEEGLKNAYNRADLKEGQAWRIVENAFPPTSPVRAEQTAQTINETMTRPIMRGETQEQIEKAFANPVLAEARMAFPKKTEQGAIASPSTTYGALNKARQDVYAKSKDLGFTQPGTASQHTADEARLYAAFKADVRNQMEKSGVDPTILDEADKATQVSKTIAGKVEDYFGKIRRKVTPSGTTMEIEKVSEKTPEAAFGKVVSSLKRGGSEINELRGLLDPDENLNLTDALYKHYATDEHGLSKIKWAKAFREMTDEAKIGFANGDPRLAADLNKLADAIGNIEKVQGFDNVKGVGRFVAGGAIGTFSGLVALMTGIPIVGKGLLVGAAGGRGISKIMNDPDIVRSIAYYTKLAPTKLNGAKRMALQGINKSIMNSQYLSDSEKESLIKLNNGELNENDNPRNDNGVAPPAAPEREVPDLPLYNQKQEASANPAFDTAMNTVFKNEGGHTTEGTPTYLGIDSKWWPNEYKEAVQIGKTGGEEAAREYAKDFYKTHFWDKYDLDNVPPEVQEIVMDGAVNHRSVFVNRLIKAAKGGASRDALLKMREAEYKRIGGSNLEGWKNRVRSMKDEKYKVARR